MSVLSTLQGSLGSGGHRIVVAFSGGSDSMALLWGLSQLAGELRLKLWAAHLDHRLDDGSGQRAREARRLASELGVPFLGERLERAPAAGESREAWARDRRYEVLERLADELAADLVVTAHHADDQAETVLLRLLYGSGIAGLAGIQEDRGRLARPFLDLRRQQLLESLAAAGRSRPGRDFVVDPTNACREVPRNRVRHHLLPVLEARDARIVERLCGLAKAAAAASRRGEEILTPFLDLRPAPEAAEHGGTAGAVLDRHALARLPEPLWVLALGALARRAGAPYPPGAPARRELRRQLRSRARIGCDCGRGWRFEGDRATLRLVGPRAGREELEPSKTATPQPNVVKFAYTLNVPGEVAIPELALRVRLRRGEVAPWMFRGRVDRAGLALPPGSGHHVLIRNRRPGDRLRPLGGAEPLRLKDLLIARRIPRQQRDRIPLMIIDGTIAWVPGVTIDERFRLRGERDAWIAEIEPMNDGAVEPPAAAARDRKVSAL